VSSFSGSIAFTDVEYLLSVVSEFTRRTVVRRRPPLGALVVAGALILGGVPEATAIPTSGDFAGLVDIGGRSLYLECHGQGAPTVLLESGLDGRGDVWSRDGLHPPGARTMVQPGVAAFTRVCAYDRPGTIGAADPDSDPGGPEFYPSRSDPVPQPRTARDAMADLHALVRAAGIPGPYVLVAHSAGGLIDRLYAGTYPDDVAGMVLVDTTHEDVWRNFEKVLTPAQYARFEESTTDDHELLAAYPEAEQLFTAPLADSPSVVEVRAAAPLHPMPMVVLAHGIPFPAPFDGWPTEEMEGVMLDAQRDLAGLVPDARLVVATESGHDIHQDQPELVIDAIAAVVAAVRDPSTWP
jgi:pimeloyl-ACP methyl ester carboxylesterase